MTYNGSKPYPFRISNKVSWCYLTNQMTYDKKTARREDSRQHIYIYFKKKEEEEKSVFNVKTHTFSHPVIANSQNKMEAIK